MSTSVCWPKCGDGKVVNASDICDDADYNNLTGCYPGCVGNWPGYSCTGGNRTAPTICTEVCGDGIKTPTETCDDKSDDNFGC